MSDTGQPAAPPAKTIAASAAPDASRVMTLFVMIVATLYFGREVLVPVTLALLLAFVLAPLVGLLRRLHFGKVPSVLVGVVLALGVILAVGGVIGSQIAELTTDIPKYAATVEAKVASVRSYTRRSWPRTPTRTASSMRTCPSPGATRAPCSASPDAGRSTRRRPPCWSSCSASTAWARDWSATVTSRVARSTRSTAQA